MPVVVAVAAKASQYNLKKYFKKALQLGGLFLCYCFCCSITSFTTGFGGLGGLAGFGGRAGLFFTILGGVNRTISGGGGGGGGGGGVFNF